MENNRGKMIKLVEKYNSSIEVMSDRFRAKGYIPSKRIDNALKTFATGMDRKTIIGFYDTTLFGNGKEGYIFTDTKVYYKESFEKPKKIWYDDIKSVELIDKYMINDKDKKIKFNLYDGVSIIWNSSLLNKTPLLNFFEELLEIVNYPKLASKQNIEYNSKFKVGRNIGEASISNYETVNKLYDEVKFGGSRGHGFAAERANDLFDKVTGKDAKIVGDNNLKNGADRLVNGVQIQSKYCKTGSKCISECFENGKMRYTIENGTKPMQIEVPSDKYDSAIQAMENRIKNGQVPGVTDISEAKNIVRKGHFTYNQAKNIAKAGTVESLIYDATNGMIIATSALGVSAAITFATLLWNNEDFDDALKGATYSGIKVGGTAFLTGVVASQMSKAGLNSALVNSSERIVKMMGPKNYKALANVFRKGSELKGAAAIRSSAKLVRGNLITAGATITILSSFDIINIFRGRISGTQLFKNLINNTSSVIGGGAGGLSGAYIGSLILPGIGTAVGALVGGMAAGSAAGKATDKVVGLLIEDDANEMVKIIEEQFQILAVDYLLNQKEAEKIIDRLKDRLDGNMLKDMFESESRIDFSRKLLIPLIESEVSKRELIKEPTYAQIESTLEKVLVELNEVL